MKLSTLIKAWEVLHVDDTGRVGFQDIVMLFEDGASVENDIMGRPRAAEAIGGKRIDEVRQH